VTTQPTQSTPENQQAMAERIKVAVSRNLLEATVRISLDPNNESPVTVEDINNALKTAGIVHGIDQQAIEKIIQNSVFDEAVTVANATLPVPGEDARLDYKFEVVQLLKPTEDDDGRIDYKDMNFIQPATKDQVLVVKIPASEGVLGTNVKGGEISAKSGRDIKLPAGSNTIVADDEIRLLAGIDGSIVFAGGRVNINEVHTIGGDICNQTGNITHNGSLIIRGKVDPGFEVTAEGDIEIAKSVCDAKITSGGNVLVKGGFLGARNGLIKARGNVFCKYVDDQIIIAGDSIKIGGELFNGLVTAKNKVEVLGSKGRIVGGKVMAGDEIKATSLGSDAGTKTELQVAYNAELMKKYNTVKSEIRQLEENTERVNEGLYVFYRMQMDGKLTPDKQAALTKLEEFKKNIPARQKELAEAKETIEAEIRQNQRARIIATEKVHPGVVLQFGVVYREITDELGPSYFCLQGETITWEDYKAGKE